MKTYVQFFSVMLFIVLFPSCNDGNNDENNPYDIPHTVGKPVVVQDISPREGGLGTRVVVSGSNFGNDKEKVKLFFNRKEALILKIQDNAIYAMVPKQPGELSTIKVVVSEKENPEGTFEGVEAELADKRFKYRLRATVTTVAGKVGVSQVKDGTLTEGTFGRPVMLAVDSTGNNIFVSDDTGAPSVRLLSLKENRMKTVISSLTRPWSCAFNSQYTEFYVVLREASSRPLLFYRLTKESNWTEGEPFYDQKDEQGNYIAGSLTYYGLTADDKYIYMLATGGIQLIRIDQKTRKVELIGNNLNLHSWSHICYNKKDKHIYVATEAGRVYKFNPYKTVAGTDKIWVTRADVTLIAGDRVGSAVEGIGKNAQFGEVEAITCDSEGNFYLADFTNHVIWKGDEIFNCTILGGVPGERGYKDGKPREALFNTSYGLAATPDGVVYVADSNNGVVRRIAIQ